MASDNSGDIKLGIRGAWLSGIIAQAYLVVVYTGMKIHCNSLIHADMYFAVNILGLQGGKKNHDDNF